MEDGLHAGQLAYVQAPLSPCREASVVGKIREKGI